MAKAEVDVSTLDFSQIKTIIEKVFCLGTAIESGVNKLYGGYSGSNYSVQIAGNKDGINKVCIKVCNSYTRSEVENQARIMHYLYKNGFKHACYAFPTQNSAYEQNQIQFTVNDNVPAPTLCLSFCQGTAADAVISPDSKIPFPVDKVLFAVGSRLAQLHKIPVVTEAQLGTYKDGGACAVIDHISDKIKTTIASSPHTCDHPFHAFYTTQLNELKLSMEAASESDLMPWGVIHGDPFLDNCLATMDTGTVEATWVDFEDVTVGPLLFDFACCIIGSCFRPSPDNTLDLNRLAALSKGYFSTRTLTPREMELLIPFLKLTLLTSCTWRFVNFNIHHREISDCRDSYVEFQQRIISLLNPELIAKITTCLTS